MMKVIDKRTENDEWRVGDVICYWNKPDKKYYGLIEHNPKFLKYLENKQLMED